MEGVGGTRACVAWRRSRQWAHQASRRPSALLVVAPALEQFLGEVAPRKVVVVPRRQSWQGALGVVVLPPVEKLPLSHGAHRTRPPYPGRQAEHIDALRAPGSRLVALAGQGAQSGRATAALPPAEKLPGAQAVHFLPPNPAAQTEH